MSPYLSDYTLKPCPFCGCETMYDGFVRIDPYSMWNDFYYVYCKRCMARSPDKKTLKEAVDAWNRRPIKEKEKEKWVF